MLSRCDWCHLRAGTERQLLPLVAFEGDKPKRALRMALACTHGLQPRFVTPRGQTRNPPPPRFSLSLNSRLLALSIGLSVSTCLLYLYVSFL